MRVRLFLVSITAAVLLLAGCSSGTQDQTSTGAWSYVSGDGKTYTKDKIPTRIVAHAYAAKALIGFGIKPVGIYADGPIADDVGLKGVDFSGVTILSEEWGKIDVEKAYSGLEGGVEKASLKLAELATVVGPSQGDSIVKLIEGYAELAKSLGADTAAIAAQRAAFDKALDTFKTAVAAKPGLSVMAISPYDDIYAIAVPKYAPELLDFQSWGLAVVDPEKPDPDFPYWQSLSFENADSYQPDVLLFDDRNFPTNEQTLAAQPISAKIKAFAAKAYTTWPAYWLHTYGDYAEQLVKLASFIAKADANTGN
jgi:iron complex transport system substrate-binding protein